MPDRPPRHLILVPGLMCDATVWAHQARHLETIATIAVSDHGSLDSLGKMAEAILGSAPARFAIAGHSMGGRVALEVFRRAPDRIEGMALMDTAYGPRPAGAPGEAETAQRYTLLERPDATPLLTEIHCPTLVLCGRQDAWSTLSRHKEIAARIEQSKLVVIEDSGHMSTMERPEQVTAAMYAWLTSL